MNEIPAVSYGYVLFLIFVFTGGTASVLAIWYWDFRQHQIRIGAKMLDGVVSHNIKDLFRTIRAGNKYSAPLNHLAESIAVYCALVGEEVGIINLNNKLAAIRKDMEYDEECSLPHIILCVSGESGFFDITIGVNEYRINLVEPGAG